jgi:8-oxo-dGTP pyrophosphatase MutT (NUDIX family)
VSHPVEKGYSQVKVNQEMTTRADTVHKVTAFVTRGDGQERELLVFRHPRAGIQLPAGTVEAGEPIEAAVLREVQEETGLTGIVIIAGLGTVPEAMGPDGRMITTRISLRAEPRETAAGIDVSLGRDYIVSEMGRGLTVRQMRDETGYLVEDGYAKIGYDRYDIRGSHDWVLRETVVGWVPLDTITADVQRHLFHLRTTGPTPARWVHHGDVPDCELYWVPLSRDPGLVRGHDTLLLGVLDQLKDDRS